jgi:hypothetical protein
VIGLSLLIIGLLYAITLLIVNELSRAMAFSFGSILGYDIL